MEDWCMYVKSNQVLFVTFDTFVNYILTFQPGDHKKGNFKYENYEKSNTCIINSISIKWKVFDVFTVSK